MKTIKILYIINYIVLGLICFAILGASGHSILNIENTESDLLLTASVVFTTLAILLTRSFYKLTITDSVGFKLFLILAIIIKLVLVFKLLAINSSGYSDSVIFVIYLLLTTIYEIYRLISSSGARMPGKGLER